MGIRAERMTRMATIEIKMLGGFEIRVNGKPVLAQLRSPARQRRWCSISFCGAGSASPTRY